MNRAVISVGSNISPQQSIEAALRILREEQHLLKASTFTHTAPVPPATGGDYLNGAFLIETALDQKDLKKYLNAIEEKLGRVRGPDKFAPRTMDLDIIIYNGLIVDNDYYEYDFVRRAVDEIMPVISNKNNTSAQRE